MGTDRMGARECYREVILDNIEYSYLVQDSHIDREQLDEIVDLIVDTVCSARKVIRIAGDDYPAEVVKSRFMKLDSSHVQYVMDCMKDNTTYVRNIKKYLLAALYNAPTTINSYYSSLVQHDMYGDGAGKINPQGDEGRETRIKPETDRVVRSEAERTGVEIRRFGFPPRCAPHSQMRGYADLIFGYSAVGRQLPDFVGSA